MINNRDCNEKLSKSCIYEKKTYSANIEFTFFIVFGMQNRKIKFKSAFTLLELVFVCIILWLILPSMVQLYTFITTSNREIWARQDAIQQWYEIFERLNVMLEDYTIDYEEYYNRQMVGCVWDAARWAGFKRNVWLSGYCTNFTAYWNYNSTNRNLIGTGYHDLYYCSNSTQKLWIDASYHKVLRKDSCWMTPGYQSFGQYKTLFVDVGKNTDNDGDAIWDSDDSNLGTTVHDMINAIMDYDNVQELYFISHDGKNRLYFRRALAATWENGEVQYRIQMLRLKWFDAWQKHNFSETKNNEWLYDGQIDTWVCDAWMWFSCAWDWIGWVYPGYNLPADVDDWWVDLTQWWSNIIAWKATVSPTTDSELARSEEKRQINAYMKLLIVSGIYPPYYNGRMAESTREFQVPIETLINMKDFYRN